MWGVVLQFPFYAGIAAIITTTHLNERLANAFVSISSPCSFPAVVAIYSAVLGVFVPSGGSKWVIEAPYVMAAAHELKVHLGWVVASYDLGEALANLLQPFWMLPTLGMFGLRARDVMGYTFIVSLALAPVVILLVTLLGATLPLSAVAGLADLLLGGLLGLGVLDGLRGDLRCSTVCAPNFLVKRSTRPSVSISFWRPVKNGWHCEQMSRCRSLLVLRVCHDAPHAQWTVSSWYSGWIFGFTIGVLPPGPGH